MTLEKIISEIEEQIEVKKLKKPNLRINSLRNIVQIINAYFKDINDNPFRILHINKDDLISEIEYITKKKLNSAEETIINQFYKVLNEKSKITFYTRSTLNRFKNQRFPCFILKRDKWDDFTYRTTFGLYYFFTKMDSNFIGDVKILKKGDQETTLPNQFESLDENIYCSLGQTIAYYKNLKEIANQIDIIKVLDILNDVAYNLGSRTNFENVKGFKKSLLRFSEAEKALQEGEKNNRQYSF